MRIPIASKESPFVRKLVVASGIRRELLTSGQRQRNSADEIYENAELLALIVNELFWASTHLEEGRAVVGTICVCAPEDAPRSRRLISDVPVCSSALVQLLVASPRSALAIYNGGGTPSVWGLLDSVPVFTLQFRIVAVGTIIVSEAGGVIAVLEQGNVYQPEGVGKMEWVALVARALGEVRPFPVRIALAERLQRIVHAIHRHRHGGTLVVVPTCNSAEQLRDIAWGHRFAASGENCVCNNLSELETAERRYADAKEQFQLRPPSGDFVNLLQSSVEAHRDLLDKLLRDVGDLSRIDGAVVIDEELRVFGFGAKLTGDGENFLVYSADALTGTTDRVPLASLGGTRHQSAARYVHSNPESMVFVASQDGRLSLFVWVVSTREVAIVRRLEHYLWEV